MYFCRNWQFLIYL